MRAAHGMRKCVEYLEKGRITFQEGKVGISQ
jgi:hypothetical protein